jgi:hypothetical protein
MEKFTPGQQAGQYNAGTPARKPRYRPGIYIFMNTREWYFLTFCRKGAYHLRSICSVTATWLFYRGAWSNVFCSGQTFFNSLMEKILPSRLVGLRF